MDKKGGIGDKVLKVNFVYIVLLVFFVFLFAIFLWQQMNGAGVWEDYYSKEITKVVNLAEPGDEITLDVHKATEIAIKNDVASFSEIFEFDNANNRICVKLSQARRSCYSYFNDVDIVGAEIELAQGENLDTNLLKFKVVKKLKGEENG